MIGFLHHFTENISLTNLCQIFIYLCLGRAGHLTNVQAGPGVVKCPALPWRPGSLGATGQLVADFAWLAGQGRWSATCQLWVVAPGRVHKQYEPGVMSQ